MANDTKNTDSAKSDEILEPTKNADSAKSDEILEPAVKEKNVENEDVQLSPSCRKKPRKRKKALYKPIVGQMEFYLGDANCSRSKFMKDQTKKSPWLNLDVFLTFNKLNWMLRETFGQANDTEDLWAALKAIPSEIFEIRENEFGRRQIKRKYPLVVLDERGNDSRTIYIERIPDNADIDILKHVFEKYGPVRYISLPKFKHNGAPKGFAFLEFELEEGINSALKGFIAAKRRISTALDPGELQSIKAFHVEQDEIKKENPNIKR